MPTIVDNLTFISRINTTAESFKAKKKKLYFFGILVFKSSWNFMLSGVEHEKKLYNLGEQVADLGSTCLPYWSKTLFPHCSGNCSTMTWTLKNNT